MTVRSTTLFGDLSLFCMGRLTLRALPTPLGEALPGIYVRPLGGQDVPTKVDPKSVVVLNPTWGWGPQGTMPMVTGHCPWPHGNEAGGSPESAFFGKVLPLAGRPPRALRDLPRG